MARGGFTGSVYYTIGSASDLVFPHQTGVFTLVCTFRVGNWNGDVIETIVDSISFSTANKGLSLYYENRIAAGSPHQIRLIVAKGTGGTPGVVIYSATSTVADGNWHTIAMTVNASSGSILCYYDGAANTPATAVYNGTTTGNMTAAARVGASTAGTAPLGGAIARFALAPFLASADEMRALTLGYPLPMRMRSSTAVDVRFGESPGDLFRVISTTATGSPTKAENPRLLAETLPRAHPSQRGLARRMALEGLYAGGGR